MRPTAVIGMLAAGALGCGPWQRGASSRPQPGMAGPRLFDAAVVYRSMGFFVAEAPLPFVASLRFLADRTPDSTLAVFAISLANHSLRFRRDGNEFVAEYHVELVFRADTATVRQVARDETIRVRSFQETLRSDESVIFQQLVGIGPGDYTVGVLVRDRNGPAYARKERFDTVPRFAGQGGAVAAPIPIYQGTGRSRVGELPRLVVNPRATFAYGTDSSRFYVEAYGTAAGARLVARTLDQAGAEVWRDTVPLVGGEGLATAMLVVSSNQLPMGQGQLQVGVAGTEVKASGPTLVSLSEQWVIRDFDQIISLLRYFDRPALVAQLRDAPPPQRPALWRQFWKDTDPVPLTPGNEALDEYFRRLQLANIRFPEESDLGWLTDRGEVFITLGDPDEVLDLSNDVTRGGGRSIRWTYTELRLTVYFQDTTGFGRYRLTPTSRAEYQRVLAQVRRGR